MLDGEVAICVRYISIMIFQQSTQTHNALCAGLGIHVSKSVLRKAVSICRRCARTKHICVLEGTPERVLCETLTVSSSVTSLVHLQLVRFEYLIEANKVPIHVIVEALDEARGILRLKRQGVVLRVVVCLDVECWLEHAAPPHTQLVQHTQQGARKLRTGPKHEGRRAVA